MCQCARPTESQTNLELTATLPVKGTSVGVVGAPWSGFRIPVRRAERETETEIRSLTVLASHIPGVAAANPPRYDFESGQKEKRKEKEKDHLAVDIGRTH